MVEVARARALDALNLGCGDSVNPYNSFHDTNLRREVWITWTRLDIRQGEDLKADVVWDLNKVPLPFEDDEFDYIYCAHVLEHLPVTHVFKRLLPELHRIMKTRGTFEVIVPNLFQATREIYSGGLLSGLKQLYSGALWKDPEEEGFYKESLHVMCYTLGMMIDALILAGFNIRCATDMYQDEECDVNVKAVKVR